MSPVWLLPSFIPTFLTVLGWFLLGCWAVIWASLQFPRIIALPLLPLTWGLRVATDSPPSPSLAIDHWDLPMLLWNVIWVCSLLLCHYLCTLGLRFWNSLLNCLPASVNTICLPSMPPLAAANLSVHASMLSHFSLVWLCATPWIVGCEAPLSMGFSRPEYWSGLPCHPAGDLPNPGTELESLISPALWVDSLLLSHQECPHLMHDDQIQGQD